MHLIFDNLELELLKDDTWYAKCPHGDAILTELPMFLKEQVKYHLTNYGILSDLLSNTEVNYDNQGQARVS